MGTEIETIPFKNLKKGDRFIRFPTDHGTCPVCIKMGNILLDAVDLNGDMFTCPPDARVVRVILSP